MSRKSKDTGDPPEPEIPVRDTGGYVESVIEAAERAAAKIRADAEADARRYLADYKKHIDNLAEERAKATDALVEQARKAKDQYDRLVGTVDSALRSSPDVGNGSRPGLEAEPEGEPSRAGRRGRTPDAPEAPARDRGTTAGGFKPRPQNAEANALAAQMIAAGSDRRSVAKRLRDELGIDDTDAVLDKLDFD
jgi:hypothetical protein